MKTKLRDEFHFFKQSLDDLISQPCEGLGLRDYIASWTGTANLDLEITADPQAGNIWIQFNPWLDTTGNVICFVFRPGELKILLEEPSSSDRFEKESKDITKQFTDEVKPASLNVLLDLMRLLFAYSRAQ